MTTKNISINDFDYPLPDERIAKHPLLQRDACKLLHYSATSGISEHTFADIPSLLPPDSMLIYNDTRVINARMRFLKESGAQIEIFCLEPVLPPDYAENFASTRSCQWLCLVGNSKRWKQGDLSMDIVVDSKPLTVKATRISRESNSSLVEFSWTDPTVTFASVIEAAGVIPIPPYLNRDTEESDSEDYQTVYSKIKGSVAAPTAGLHFTDDVLKRISDKGIIRSELTLHVGAGTFQPVKEDDVALHQMHSEYISVSKELIASLASTSRKIYAVGTTSVRTLESLYHIGCLMAQGEWSGEVPQWYPYSPNHPNLSVQASLTYVLNYLEAEGLSHMVASTRIIIAPGYTYRMVEGIITNFHQPKSTLLLLVSAFIGDAWREVYDYALDHDFRFLSYGDACLFER